MRFFHFFTRSFSYNFISDLLEADSEEQVSVKADENSGVMWFSPEDALEKSTEPWFVEHIYSKLIKKMGI